MTIFPHKANRRYFARWIDFRVKIYNADMRDSGIYSVKVVSPTGHTEHQMIFVDISEKKKRSSRLWEADMSHKKYANNENN